MGDVFEDDDVLFVLVDVVDIDPDNEDEFVE